MDSLDDLVRLLTSSEPEDLRRDYLATPSAELRAFGSTAPLLGAQGMRVLTDLDLAVPVTAGGPAPIDYMHVYVTLDQYFLTNELANVPLEAIARSISHRLTRTTALVHLALLNSVILDLDRLADLEEGFLEILQPDVRLRLRNILAGRNELGRHHLLARQPLLAAIRYVLLDDDAPARDQGDLPPMFLMALLSHAVGATLGSAEQESEELVGVPRHLFFELLRLGLLYQTDDMWSTIDRVVRLWRTYGERLVRTTLRATPCDLLRQATGVELVELLGLGFALYAHASQWEHGKPALVARDMGSKMDGEKRDAFLKLVSASPEELRTRFLARSDSSFDFLPFQERPVVELEAGLLVLDAAYLWDRVTSGLYWMVHDAEKTRSESDRHRWTQAFAEAVEMMCEDNLRVLAPVDLGGGTTYYTEDDLGAAYGGKRSDAVIDFGDAFLVAEVVSGQLSIPTRIDGDVAAFVADTERLVIKKCRQLDGAARSILADGGAALRGFSVGIHVTVVPLLVVGGGYPINPFTVDYIEQQLRDEGLLSDPRLAPLSIIDLAELELLEGLAERGPDPVSVLGAWKRSGLAGVSLRNYVLKEYDGGRHLRPARMKTAVEATFAEVLAALRLPQGD